MRRLGLPLKYLDFENKNSNTINTWFEDANTRFNVQQTYPSDAVLGDIPEGQWGFFNNTANDTLNLMVNNGGRLVKMALESTKVISVKAYGAVGDGVTDDYNAIVAARTAAIAQGAVLLFPGGENHTYVISQTLQFATTDIRVRFEGGARLKHTGTGIAFKLMPDSGYVFNAHIENPRVEGNANTTDAFYISSFHHVRIDNPSATNFSSAFMRFKWCIEAQINQPICSNNEAVFTTTPAYGIIIDETAAGYYSVNVTIIDPIIEGVSGTGIWFQSAHHCQVYGGTSEGNGIGIDFQPGSVGNKIEGMWFEANTTRDIEIHGRSNQIIDCYVGSSAMTNNIENVNADSTQIIGGYVRCINLQSTSTNTTMIGTRVSDNVSLGVQGTGTRRCINVVKVNSSEVVTGSVDEFEDSTFTPSIAGSTTAGSHTYSTRSGTYYRVGNMVYFTAYMVMTAKDASMAGITIVTGLPYTVREYAAITVAEANNIAYAAGATLAAYASKGTKTIILIQNQPSAAAGTVGAAAISNTTSLMISGSYLV